MPLHKSNEGWANVQASASQRKFKNRTDAVKRSENDPRRNRRFSSARAATVSAKADAER